MIIRFKKIENNIVHIVTEFILITLLQFPYTNSIFGTDASIMQYAYVAIIIFLLLILKEEKEELAETRTIGENDRQF